MATVITDTLKTLEYEEIDGAPARLLRSVQVGGLTENDYQALSEALSEAGVPEAGTSPTGMGNLLLVRRTAKMLQGTTNTAEIILEYTTQAQQEINFFFSGASGAQQISTEKDRNGNQILVEHEYPDDDDEFGEAWKVRHDSSAVKQGGTINVLTTQATAQATAILNTYAPLIVALGWQNHLNSTPWGGAVPFLWMCTRVAYQVHNSATTPGKWKFTFEFQYDPHGWKPVAVFIDSRSSKPPQDLIEGTGTKTVDWYPTRNFNKLFPT